jgi:hypothetical protein
VVGILTSGLTATDGADHFFLGFGTGQALGLLKRTSDVTILIVLLPLVFATIKDKRKALTLLAISVLGATIPHFVFLDRALATASYFAAPNLVVLGTAYLIPVICMATAVVPTRGETSGRKVAWMGGAA